MQTTQKRQDEDIKVRRPTGPLHFIDASGFASPVQSREPDGIPIGLSPYSIPYQAPSWAQLTAPPSPQSGWPQPQAAWPQQAAFWPQAAAQNRSTGTTAGFAAAFPSSPINLPGHRVPACDLVDEGGEYVCQIELPGVKRENVDVSCFERALLVTAHAEPDIDVGALVLSERSNTASYRRAINLPSEVHPGEAKATLRDGILTISLPKSRPTEGPKRIPVA